MKYVQVFVISLVLIFSACNSSKTDTLPEKVLGKLKVGFDIDDTVLFSRDNFLVAPHMSDDPDHLDYAWVNTHDSLHSVLIQPVADLIGFFKSHGHEVYFITARPGINGATLARHLSRELGFKVEKNIDLFFSPKRKDPKTGVKYTTKHEVIAQLGLHIFYGDADNDMVAACVAGVRGVRIVRDPRSVESYSSNYFGDTRSESGPDKPYKEADYQRFLTQGVGPYGETIFPIYQLSPNPSELSVPEK
ncbi:hypothetical protein HQ531_08120 [bacterium]|nr:hypothetical protein [bacterium]